MAGELKLRKAQAADVEQIAEIWQAGWRDGHIGLVPDELVPERTPETFLLRARERMVSRFDLDLTEPLWALGYRFDIVLRGRESTPFEQRT